MRVVQYREFNSGEQGLQELKSQVSDGKVSSRLAQKDGSTPSQEASWKGCWEMQVTGTSPLWGAGNGNKGQKQMIMVIVYANTWLQVLTSYFGTIKLVLPLQMVTFVFLIF